LSGTKHGRWQWLHTSSFVDRIERSKQKNKRSRISAFLQSSWLKREPTDPDILMNDERSFLAMVRSGLEECTAYTAALGPIPENEKY
jgi:hypothetical protein